MGKGVVTRRLGFALCVVLLIVALPACGGEQAVTPTPQRVEPTATATDVPATATAEPEASADTPTPPPTADATEQESAPTAALPPLSAETGRNLDPVVLTGEQLGAFIGLELDEIVGWRYSDGAWQQIPVQVDERDWVDLVAARGRNRVIEELVVPGYVDAAFAAGPDSDPAFDADDELVFLARDVGQRAPADSAPPGTLPGTGSLVTVTDPLDGSDLGAVYLFQQDGTLEPAAGMHYVTYTYTPVDAPRNAKATPSGPEMDSYVDEDTTVETVAYTHHFSARWRLDGMTLADGSMPDANLLDRFRAQLRPGDCARSEDTFSTGNPIFLVNKSGPIRAIRSYMGANSGNYTARTHLFYPQRHDMVTDVRVHAVNGLMWFIDYSDQAQGMRYVNSRNQDGVIIDGVDDVLAPGIPDWEMVTGDQGTFLITSESTTTIPNVNPVNFYADQETPARTPCTGDASYFGASGWMHGGMPCTDPARVENDQQCPTPYSLQLDQHAYYLPPNLPAEAAQAYYTQASTPLEVRVELVP